jgi:UDP-N-acetylmuramate dehydrogenase
LNLEDLKDMADVSVELQKDLTNRSTMRVKAIGDIITVHSPKALRETIKRLNDFNHGYRVLGLGANQILHPSPDYAYLKLEFPFEKKLLDNPRENYLLPASLPLNVLTSHAIRFGLKGWESFTGIPATLGGAVFMNAGTSLGEIGELIKSVHIATLDGGQRIEMIKNDSFAYRKNNFLKGGEVIFNVEMGHQGISKEISEKIKSYLSFRNESQPLDAKTFGCMFKNPEGGPAGKFIDLVGLKGFTQKDLRISPKHGNFLENMGEADYFDVLKVLEMVKMELELQYGIKFNREVEL